MYLFNALIQKHIIVAQQLIGASRTSSQNVVSTVVGHSYPNSPAPTPLSYLCNLRSIAISITKHQTKSSIIPTGSITIFSVIQCLCVV